MYGSKIVKVWVLFEIDKIYSKKPQTTRYVAGNIFSE